MSKSIDGNVMPLQNLYQIREMSMSTDNVLSQLINHWPRNSLSADLALRSAEMLPLIRDMQNASTEAIRQITDHWNEMNRTSKVLYASIAPYFSDIHKMCEAASMSIASPLKDIHRMSDPLSASMKSLLADLPHGRGGVPTYIAVRHLGSGPFREDTYQDDADTLMVIRWSDLHPDVLEYCAMQLSNGDYSGAVFEAIKGLCQKIRDRTGLQYDGSQLIERAFSNKKGRRLIAVNLLETPCRFSRQEDFIAALKSLISEYRNPMAHKPRDKFSLGKPEALLVLFRLSEYHRLIDHAIIRKAT